MSRPDMEVRLDERDLAQVLRDAKVFDKNLAKATRQRLRDAGKEGVKAVQQRLLSRPHKTDTGLARGLARGTKVHVHTTGRTTGMLIKTTGLKLPPEKQAMVRAYNKRSFRHPVFGNRDVWAAQEGRPYFGAVLEEKKPQIRAAVEKALDDALHTIRAGTVR